MIHYIKGNLFDSPAQVLVNTVNTVGVMGKGIAKEFKIRYPQMFDIYKQKCLNKEFNIGNLFYYKAEEKWILNFPTKADWRQPSRLSYIEEGLQKFRDTYIDVGVNSIAFPKLGCGNGGLEWKDVKLVMEKYLHDLPIDIYIYLTNYESVIPKYKNIDNMKKCLQDDIRLISLETFKKELMEADSIQTHQFNDEQLQDFWIYLKSGNIIKTAVFPFGLDNIKMDIISLLERKNYIQHLKIDNDDAIAVKHNK